MSAANQGPSTSYHASGPPAASKPVVGRHHASARTASMTCSPLGVSSPTRHGAGEAPVVATRGWNGQVASMRYQGRAAHRSSVPSGSRVVAAPAARCRSGGRRMDSSGHRRGQRPAAERIDGADERHPPHRCGATLTRDPTSGFTRAPQAGRVKGQHSPSRIESPMMPLPLRSRHPVGGWPSHDHLHVGPAAALPPAAPTGTALLRRRSDARVLALCYWQPRPRDAATHARPARTRRVGHRSLHAGHGGQGLRARHERRAAQPAQLRRNRTPLGDAVPFRA